MPSHYFDYSISIQASLCAQKGRHQGITPFKGQGCDKSLQEWLSILFVADLFNFPVLPKNVNLSGRKDFHFILWTISTKVLWVDNLEKKVTYKTLENFPHMNLTDHKIRSLSSALASGQPVMAWGPWWGKTWAAGLILATPTTLKRSPHLRWS